MKNRNHSDFVLSERVDAPGEMNPFDVCGRWRHRLSFLPAQLFIGYEINMATDLLLLSTSLPVYIQFLRLHKNAEVNNCAPPPPPSTSKKKSHSDYFQNMRSAFLFKCPPAFIVISCHSLPQKYVGGYFCRVAGLLSASEHFRTVSVLSPQVWLWLANIPRTSFPLVTWYFSTPLIQ